MKLSDLRDTVDGDCLFDRHRAIEQFAQAVARERDRIGLNAMVGIMPRCAVTAWGYDGVAFINEEYPLHGTLLRWRCAGVIPRGAVQLAILSGEAA